MHLSTLKTLCHSYISYKCIFRHSRHCTIHILCVNYCMLSLIFRHSRHCTIHISMHLSNSRHCAIHICLTNASFDTQDIVPFIYLFKMHLSTLKTLYHSNISYKCICRHSKLYHSYFMCKLLYAVFDLSTLKTFYHSYIYLKCIFRHSRNCAIHIPIYKCIFRHSRHCTIHILCVNYCMLSLIFRHSRHCTIHISI